MESLRRLAVVFPELRSRWSYGNDCESCRYLIAALIEDRTSNKDRSFIRNDDINVLAVQ